MRAINRDTRILRFELCEERTLMSSQPVEPGGGQISDAQQPAVFPTLTEAHRLTGWTAARNEYGFDGRGQTVAVIDSGIGYDHASLGGGFGAGYRVVGGWDFTEENDGDPYDDGPTGSHGTHVAGIIGSSHSVHTGVAPGIDLVALRVFNDAGRSNFTWVEQALQWVQANRYAFAHPITTVNLSLGSAWNSETVPNWANLEEEFQQLNRDGIFISVSAGNSFTRYDTTGLSYPAASDYVVPVASVTDTGTLSSFSQRSPRVIAAPGQSITSTVPDYRGNQNGRGDDFLPLSGTSMAAPYVAGASAVIRQALEFLGYTGVNQQTIYQWMRNTADTIHDTATNLDYARLNLDKALDAIMPADDFGSDAASAHHLGAISNTTAVAGLIGKRSDLDFFRFTATASGRVTVYANMTHGAIATWQVDGPGVNTRGSGASFSFQVTTGQSYSLGLGSGGKLGFYNLTLTAAPDHLPLMFDETYYLSRYADVQRAVQAGQFTSGWQHFHHYGQNEGRSPFAVYDEARYLAKNPDVGAAVRQGMIASGLVHYLRYGQYEGRSPSDLFDGRFYLNQYADVRAAVERGLIASGLEHFIHYGRFEGRLGIAAGSNVQVVGPQSTGNAAAMSSSILTAAVPIGLNAQKMVETPATTVSYAVATQDLGKMEANATSIDTMQGLSTLWETAVAGLEKAAPNGLAPLWGPLPASSGALWADDESLRGPLPGRHADKVRVDDLLLFQQRELVTKLDQLYAELSGD